MKKIYAASLLFVAILSAPLSFIHATDTKSIILKCTSTANQLKQLANANPGNACSGDLNIAAAYIDSTAFLLYYQKLDDALNSISSAQSELTAISMSRGYCTTFASQAKGFTVNVIQINTEIKSLKSFI